jgi:hypothetical protein
MGVTLGGYRRVVPPAENRHMNLDTKEATAIAKSRVLDQLSGEGVQDVGLEEVKFESGYWNITIGFSRAWDRNSFADLASWRGIKRIYKVIVISDDSEKVVEMRNREAA